MDREWYRAMRDKHVLSLVIADIDNFKLCNDTHGHAAGDMALKSVAALLERHIHRQRQGRNHVCSMTATGPN